MIGDRLRAWLTAVVLAGLGGALLGVPVILLARRWLGDWPDGSWGAAIAIGYVAWAATSVAISAFWLRRQARR